MKRALRWFALIAFLVLVPWERARAYFDPGAGSLLLQVILGSVVGAALMVRRKIAAIMKKLFGRRSE